MELVVTPGGQVRCLYAETIDLAALGTLSITRASFVEPDEAGNWWADLAPMHGPRLGPFHRRSDALRAEQAWLEERLETLHFSTLDRAHACADDQGDSERKVHGTHDPLLAS